MEEPCQCRPWVKCSPGRNGVQEAMQCKRKTVLLVPSERWRAHCIHKARTGCSKSESSENIKQRPMKNMMVEMKSFFRMEGDFGNHGGKKELKGKDKEKYERRVRKL